MLGPQCFHQRVKCVYIYICFLYIVCIVIDIYIHINQLWIRQAPKNCDKQLSQLYGAVSTVCFYGISLYDKILFVWV